MRGETMDQIAAKFYSWQDTTPGSWLLPLRLPSLRAFWANSFDEAAKGKWYDQTDGGNDLSETGAPVIGQSTTWPGALVPYIELDGTNDFYSIADNAALSILGDITIGCWVYPDTIGNVASMGIVNKYFTTGDLRSYELHLNTNDEFILHISETGTAATQQDATSPAITAAAQWYFVCARFDAGTSLSIRVNSGDWTTETGTPPASIFDNARALIVGEYNENANTRWDGRIAQVWICAYHVKNAVVDWLFKAQAPDYGIALQ